MNALAELQFPINETVNLLVDRNEQRLRELRAKFPKYSELLTPGMQMGDVDSSHDREKLVFVTEVVQSAMDEAHQEASSKLDKAKKSIRFAANLQTLMQAITILLSGATLTLIGLEQHRIAQLTSIGAVLGSFLGLIGERLLAVVDPSAGSYRVLYVRLTGLLEKLNGLRRQARIYLKYPPTEEVVSDLSKQANGVCAELKELLAQLT